MQKIQDIMNGYRANMPKEAGGYQILKVRDYQEDTITDLVTGEVTPTGLPKSNVLYFDMSDNAWCAIRPSGTEPKIKFYFGVKGNDSEDADQRLEKLTKDPVFQVED